MKKRLHILKHFGKTIAVSLLAFGSAVGIQAALTKNDYASNSLLASGKWVKVGVEQTGVYEISYETLKAMGFSDPAKVSVYGRGGRMMPESFVSNAGVPIITDDIAPAKVLHEDGKLYFYGLGPEEIGFETSSEYGLEGYFVRKSNNIYSKRGYYFLTDTKNVEKMTVKDYDSSGSPNLEYGISYVYHELDSVQNYTHSGQLFWGEYLGLPNDERRRWDVEMPDALEDKGVMQCEIYFEDRDFGSAARVSYGFEGTGNFLSVPYKKNNTQYYAPHQPTLSGIDIPGEKGKVFVEFKDAEDMGNYSNLDFWVISYKRGIPDMEKSVSAGLAQQLLAFPSVQRNNTGRLELSNSASLVVLDVSTPTDPQRLTLSQKGSVGVVGVHNTSKTPLIIIFDKETPQLQISGYDADYSIIENQNLHALKDEGADFIIITTPKFKEYAQQIADLHKEYDGIKTVVATTEELYNEFSGGVPDAMAYKSFAKMLYFSDRKPKNVLLFGPLYGDARGIMSENDPSETIIAYQSPDISTSRGSYNINDFYGMMGDKFRTDYYERNEVNLGVGMLPVKFESEAKIVVDKIRSYLERDDHAYFLNLYTGIGGLGNNHTHDTQVRDIYNHIRALDSSGTVFTPLAIDTYGNSEAKKKFINRLNEGCNMFSYFGHGAEQFLGQDRYFFNAGDVFALRNKTLPFALFGGCLITNTDRGFRGLGESIITGTPYGCIGSIVSSRDTWSGQNLEFFKQFFICMYRQGSEMSSPQRTNPATIGEIYASVKNYSTYANELAYQLVCDPALVIPTVNRLIKVNIDDSSSLTPGDKFTVKGTVVFPDGSKDSNFNGTLVARLNEPEVTIPAGKIETGEDPGSLAYVYGDEQLSLATAKVVNGEFTVELHVPASIGSFEGEQALLYFSSYDPSTKTGAASGHSAMVGKVSADSEELTDKVPPVIELMEFSAPDCSINLTASDNVALNLSRNPLNKGIYLYVDGKEKSEAHFSPALIDPSRPAYSKSILLDGLTYGEHSARLKVKDAAGNYTEQEITFTYNPTAAKFIIQRDADSPAGMTRISIDSSIPANSTLVVLSSTGEEVWRGQTQGNYIEWNHVNNNGEKVIPGHYKAYLIETGDGTQKGHSESIDIPVI